MELDHDTGGLEGLVLAGRHEAETLGEHERWRSCRSCTASSPAIRRAGSC